MVRVVEIVVVFVVTANLFFGDCRFLGGFIFLVTETSAKSAIEPDPAYSIHTRSYSTTAFGPVARGTWQRTHAGRQHGHVEMGSYR